MLGIRGVTLLRSHDGYPVTMQRQFFLGDTEVVVRVTGISNGQAEITEIETGEARTVAASELRRFNAARHWMDAENRRQ